MKDNLSLKHISFLLYFILFIIYNKNRPSLLSKDQTQHNHFFQSFCLPSMAVHNSDILGKSYRQEEIQYIKELFTILQVNMHVSKDPKNV